MHIYKHWAIPEKTKRGGGGKVEDMKFPVVLRKWQVEFQGLIS